MVEARGMAATWSPGSDIAEKMKAFYDVGMRSA
jgi:hypothetical protein